MSKQLIVKARNSRKDASLASRRKFVSAAAAFSAVGGAKAAQAQPTQNSQNLTFKNTPGLFPPRGYSHLAEVMGPHRILYLSGQVPIDHNGIVPQGAQAQFTLVFENLKATLAAAGATFDHVAKITVYMTDMRAQLPILQQARGKFLNAATPAPASTLVQVGALANPSFLIEIEAIAILPS